MKRLRIYVLQEFKKALKSFVKLREKKELYEFFNAISKIFETNNDVIKV